MEEREHAIGREMPTQEDIAAIQLGIRRYGVAGLVKKTGSGWSIVAGAGFGQPVKAESLWVLRDSLRDLSLYVEQVASA